jgi:hypothetical protein
MESFCDEPFFVTTLFLPFHDLNTVIQEIKVEFLTCEVTFNFAI